MDVRKFLVLIRFSFKLTQFHSNSWRQTYETKEPKRMIFSAASYLLKKKLLQTSDEKLAKTSQQ